MQHMRDHVRQRLSPVFDEATLAAASDSVSDLVTPQSTAQERWRHVTVMPVSHVGGHEWAGNVLAFPGGHWFGRVQTRAHVASLLDAYVTAHYQSPASVEHLLSDDMRARRRNTGDGGTCAGCRT